MSKIRRIDFYPDEFIAGVSGQMSPEDIGVYWMVCTLIYSSGGPIKNDPRRLALMMGGAHVRTIKAALLRLQEGGKITCTDAELSVKRCLTELEKTGERIAKNVANGSLGGKKSSKNNETTEANAYSDAKANQQAKNHPAREPPTNNHQPTTTNQHSSPPSVISDPTPYRSSPEWADPIIDATGIDPCRYVTPGIVSKHSTGLDNLVNLAIKLELTVDDAVEAIREAKDQKDKENDHPNSYNFYIAVIERVGSIRALKVSTGPAESLVEIRARRISSTLRGVEWNSKWGTPPSQAEINAMSGWKIGQPVPDVVSGNQR